MKPTYRKSWVRNLLIWSDLNLGPLLQGQTRMAKFKSAYNLLILVLDVCNMKTTDRKSSGVVRFDQKSSGVVRFDLGPLLRGQMKCLLLTYYWSYRFACENKL